MQQTYTNVINPRGNTATVHAATPNRNGELKPICGTSFGWHAMLRGREWQPTQGPVTCKLCLKRLVAK